jgi:hypothetical protein
MRTGEERFGLGQDERVGAALTPGHVSDRQFGRVDPGVDVLPALLGERSLEGPSALVIQERAEGTAQVAGAAARGQFDRPVAGCAAQAVQPAAEPCRAVGCQITEPGLTARAVSGQLCRYAQRGHLQRGHRVSLLPGIAGHHVPGASHPYHGGGRQHRGERFAQDAESFSSRRLGDGDVSPAPMS